jgi:hypothetical protein
MMNAKFGLIAIPMMFMMMCVPTGAQACMGGEPGHTWFDEPMNATAHNYTARSFMVEKSASNIHVQYHPNTKVYILNDEAMGNFTAGKPCEKVFDSNSTNAYDYLNLTAGKYWVVLDNRDVDGLASQQISVERYALKENGGCGEINPFVPRAFVPGPSSGLVALSMIMAAFVALVIKKRPN